DFPTSEPVPCSIKARVIKTAPPATAPHGRACPGHPRLGRGAVRGREDVDARNKSGQGEWGKTSKFDPRLRLDAGAERVLDELHPEGGSGFSLAGAGMNDQETALLGLGRKDLAACRLPAFHLFPMQPVDLVFGESGHIAPYLRSSPPRKRGSGASDGVSAPWIP